MEDFGLPNALKSLREALNQDPNENLLAIDATIHRFEYTTELFWKVLKKFLEVEGKIAKTPKQALQEAYQIEWIHDEELWIDMLKDRNETSHTYNEDLAKDIYSHVAAYYKQMNEVYEMLKSKK